MFESFSQRDYKNAVHSQAVKLIEFDAFHKQYQIDYPLGVVLDDINGDKDAERDKLIYASLKLRLMYEELQTIGNYVRRIEKALMTEYINVETKK
jgi:hypothetical protein